MSDSQPYELWETRRHLGVMRDVEPTYNYWLPFFGSELRSEDEYIDFTKLPARGRKIAPLVMPLGRGKPIYEDQETAYRFRPAYVKVEDQIDDLMPLRRRAGIDTPMIDDTTELTPMQRLNAIRAQMTADHVASIWRRWDWMAAKAIIDAKVTLSGEDYPTTLVDFQRAANHTVVLTGGSCWGQPGVSIVDEVQKYGDRMNDAPFGGIIGRITMGSDVWKVVRKDSEFRDHLDTTLKGGNITYERGLVSSDKVFKVGEMLVGGASGQRIELWVNNDTYVDPETGLTERFLGSKEVVFTSSADAINGYRCFGRIIDRKAQYKALPIFPKSWESGGDTSIEYLTHKSAPLMVPVNPNATLKVTALD
jgi:hypothetical protein